MTVEEYKSYFEKDVLKNDELEKSKVSHNETHTFYHCPGCGKDCGHYAMRGYEKTTISRVLHCWITGKQWFIDMNVQGIILKEEIKFGKLIDTAKQKGLLGKQVSGKEAFRLYTEQGLPVELFECTEIDVYDALMDVHSEKSKGK